MNNQGVNNEMSHTINLETKLLTPEDALLCLEDEAKVILPIPNVRACNNLDEYLMRSTAHKSQQHASSDRQQSKQTSEGGSRTSLPSPFEKPSAVPLERNFDRILKKPDEGQASSINLNNRSRRSKPDVFNRVEMLDETSGPMYLLKTRLQKTIKIVIRRRRKVAYLSRVIEYKGILTMFDKHMNIYLKDVIESFKYAIGDKVLKRARHRDNLLLRGDNIILIS